MSLPLARLQNDATNQNTVNSPTALILFQKSPGKASGDVRGIEKLDWRVLDGASNIINHGTTAADGRIEVEVRGDSATLQLLVNNNPIATYLVSIRDADPEDISTVSGVQRRLRAVGYQIGDAGDDQNGVDGNLGPQTDRAIHDFQADHALKIDGNVGPRTNGALEAGLG